MSPANAGGICIAKTYHETNVFNQRNRVIEKEKNNTLKNKKKKITIK